MLRGRMRKCELNRFAKPVAPAAEPWHGMNKSARHLSSAGGDASVRDDLIRKIRRGRAAASRFRAV